VRHTQRIGSVLISALLLSIEAMAEPMDLRDPTPRAIEVAFEVSPQEKPTQTDTVYTQNLMARFEPADVPGQVRITVDRRDVENVLLAGHEAVPDSVSDFVWIFDVQSGEVLSAKFSGRLMQDLDWGLFHSTAETKIELDMETQRVGGVEEPRHWLGQTLYGYCDDPSKRSCEIVSGRRYDSDSGYVYAVGALQVHFGKLTLPTFSPLGEAVFVELDARHPGTAVAAALEGMDQSAAAAPLNSLAAAASQSASSLPAVSAGPSSN